MPAASAIAPVRGTITVKTTAVPTASSTKDGFGQVLRTLPKVESDLRPAATNKMQRSAAPQASEGVKASNDQVATGDPSSPPTMGPAGKTANPVPDGIPASTTQVAAVPGHPISAQRAYGAKGNKQAFAGKATPSAAAETNSDVTGAGSSAKALQDPTSKAVLATPEVNDTDAADSDNASAATAAGQQSTETTSGAGFAHVAASTKTQVPQDASLQSAYQQSTITAADPANLSQSAPPQVSTAAEQQTGLTLPPALPLASAGLTIGGPSGPALPVANQVSVQATTGQGSAQISSIQTAVQTSTADRKATLHPVDAAAAPPQLELTSSSPLDQMASSISATTVSTAATVAASPSTHAAPSASPIEQLAPTLLTLAKTTDGSQQMTVSLQPLDLGLVQVKIARAASGATQIEVSAENPATLLALQRDQPQLHKTLDDAGIPTTDRTVTFHIAQAASSNGDTGSSGSHGGSQQGLANRTNASAADADGSAGGGRSNYTSRERNTYSSSKRSSMTPITTNANVAAAVTTYRIGLDITA